MTHLERLWGQKCQEKRQDGRFPAWNVLQHSYSLKAYATVTLKDPDAVDFVLDRRKLMLYNT